MGPLPENQVEAAGPPSPDQLAGATWQQLLPYYEALATEPLTEANIEAWLQRWSDLDEVVGEAATLASIAYSKDTRNVEAEAANRRWQAEIQPLRDEQQVRLQERLLDLGWSRADLITTLRRFRNQRNLFRPESIPLRKRLADLASQYQRLAGGLSVEWDGQTIPLPELQKPLQAPERAVRERAWRLNQEAWLARRDELRRLFDEMMAARVELARNAGFSNFRDFAHLERNRFDYTPEDSLSFDEAVADVFVPLASRFARRRAEKLGLDSVRPWDMAAGFDGEEPLRPYETETELVEGARRIFDVLDPRFGAHFGVMAKEGLLDLGARVGKRPGAYSTGLPHRRRAFVYANMPNTDGGVRTLLHECGHAFHFFESLRWPLLFQRFPGPEMAEVASMSMELLGGAFLERDRGGFYGPRDARRSRAQHLRGIIHGLPYLVQVDAFQHWLYTDPAAADAEARDERWRALTARFQPWLDHSGLAELVPCRWYQQGHIWYLPFYYIEYAIARLGSLQVWRHSQQDPRGAVDAYASALGLGGTEPLPRLFESAGAQLIWDAKRMRELAAFVEEQLELLGSP